MKTFSAKPAEVRRDWYLVDADGRLAQIYYGFKPSHMEKIEHDIKTLLESMPPAKPDGPGGLR